METLGTVEQSSLAYSPAGSPRKWVKRSFKVNGAWYSTFVNDKNRPSLDAVNEGDSVKIDYEQKGDFRNINHVTVVSAAKQDAPAKGKEAVATYNPNVKEFRITFLASRRDAIEFVKAGLQLELLSLGTKKADKMDLFYDLVNKYAAKMAADAWHAEKITEDATTDEAVEEAKQYAVE